MTKLTLNFPSNDHEILESVPDVEQALHVVYVHIQQNIVGFSCNTPRSSAFSKFDLFIQI